MSQSPDGDFFDPEDAYAHQRLARELCHSPLTGIFLIRSPVKRVVDPGILFSHSPLTGIFLIRSKRVVDPGILFNKSQSPDGDFFDPEWRPRYEHRYWAGSHSPLTGIFLIRSVMHER